MSRTASAPGKLLLLGEYAVRHGAPALVTAVDRRAVVEISESDVHAVEAPTLGLGLARFDRSGRFHEDVPAVTAEQLRLAATVVSLAEAPPCRLSIDTSGFYDQGHKLGLGSSAAVAVAVAAAMRPRGSSADWLELAERAQNQAHEHRGSGADLCASAYGGTLVFRRGAPPTPWRLPPGVHVEVVWTGVSASTPALVAAVDAFAERDPASHGRMMAQLAAIAEEAARGPSPENFLDLVRSYEQGMLVLGRQSGADIVSEPHRALAALVQSVGGAYKPSGAGGGDVGAAFVLGDPRPLRRELSKAQIATLPVRIGAVGPTGA